MEKSVTKSAWLAEQFDVLQAKGYRKDGYIGETKTHVFHKREDGKDLFDSVCEKGWDQNTTLINF